ncbi:MAG: tetratricopeptide repeat protein [Nevskia sp.]|nr:tetratricopeptide repeat protein [Nevskia sp.]
MSRRCGLAAAACLLAACSTPYHGGTNSDPLDQQAPHLKQEEIRTDLIRQMLDKGEYYAALANIEDQKRGGGSDELTLLEADARRHLGQLTQADTLYRRLFATRYAAEAYHGLGLLYTTADLDTAIASLRFAVKRAPTNVDFRNDLGYALMEAGRYTEAMPELSTAAELAPDQSKSRNNLIILMILMGDETAVRRLAQESAVTPDRMQVLRDSAKSIRDKQLARAAKAG